jgi:hypothetical protein
VKAAAAELGSDLNSAPASFIEFKPAQFLRPFFAHKIRDAGESERRD